MGEALRSTIRVDVRPWPGDPTIAHLILLDVQAEPTDADVTRWVDEIFSADSAPTPFDGPIDRPDTIRTGALFPAAADAFGRHDFGEVDRLVLLERALAASAPIRHPARHDRAGRSVRLSRLRRRDLAAAARIDEASFPNGWSNDADSLARIAGATPQSHARLASVDGSVAGFALTGRAGTTGYLQRIAVAPSARRRGVARILVEDSIRWLVRRGADNVLVNTGIDNRPALDLYESLGFRRRHEELVVMELSR